MITSYRTELSHIFDFEHLFFPVLKSLIVEHSDGVDKELEFLILLNSVLLILV
jgi:hypothetical protein